jgi:acetyltransferase-like isoleucine patch superfamily enzyme
MSDSKKKEYAARVDPDSGSTLHLFLKSLLMKVFRIPMGCPVRFGILWRVGRLFGINRQVPWPVHFTSTVRASQNVKLGKGTFPGDSPHCYIQALNGIEIGDYTNLGPGVGLISANHDPVDNNRWLKGPPIIFGKHCWIGMNAVILPGVELGDGTVVGAGAVVTKSFPQGYCLLAGNPARVIRQLENDLSHFEAT